MGQDTILSQILTSFSQKQKEQTRDDENNAAAGSRLPSNEGRHQASLLSILIGSCQ
jgi:hypothetical protein